MTGNSMMGNSMMGNMTRTYVVALLCVACLMAAASVACVAQGMAGPSQSWKLAFVRKGDIWVANGVGTGQKRIIKQGMRPRWSPDRKHLAFVRGSLSFRISERNDRDRFGSALSADD